MGIVRSCLFKFSVLLDIAPYFEFYTMQFYLGRMNITRPFLSKFSLSSLPFSPSPSIFHTPKSKHILKQGFVLFCSLSFTLVGDKDVWKRHLFLSPDIFLKPLSLSFLKIPFQMRPSGIDQMSLFPFLVREWLFQCK